ncbi:MAG TPA: hypothetical protein VK826_06090 [Bacteroidia bacterium]|nr:hypothetical protein [Bacteroidia bacterium]
MKKLLFLFGVLLTVSLNAQVDKDSIVGTWVHVDDQGRAQKLVITIDSVTVVGQSLRYGSTDIWDTVSYSGRYTIINGNTLHVIYWDDPREEQFYEIIKQENGTMTVQLRVPIKKKHGDSKIYKRE